MMNRDWHDFKSVYGNIAGAREAFEGACETLFRKVHPNKHVSQVALKQGDGGIDIFIGELGVEPITVIQCKFFLETFDDSQKAQIRESFSTAIEATKYELKEWILCLPRVIDIDESSWWFKWKNKKNAENSKPTNFIKLINGNELINLMKTHGIYNQIFQIEDSMKLDELHKLLIPKKTTALSSTKLNTILFNNYTKKNEPFYIKRDQDTSFNHSFEVSNIWIFGKSGVGKTALINRNFIINDITYVYCDLSPIDVNSSSDILEEILCSIEVKFEINRCTKENNSIKSIVNLLNTSVQTKVAIVIDEFSILRSHLQIQTLQTANFSS